MPTATVRRGVGASDDRKWDAADCELHGRGLQRAGLDGWRTGLDSSHDASPLRAADVEALVWSTMTRIHRATTLSKEPHSHGRSAGGLFRRERRRLKRSCALRRERRCLRAAAL